MENPKAGNPLPETFRNGLLLLPNFSVGLSVANWCTGHVNRMLDLQRAAVAGLSAAATR